MPCGAIAPHEELLMTCMKDLIPDNGPVGTFEIVAAFLDPDHSIHSTVDVLSRLEEVK